LTGSSKFVEIVLGGWVTSDVITLFCADNFGGVVDSVFVEVFVLRALEKAEP
jgi:hypothetical protein